MWHRLLELLEDPFVSVARVAAVVGEHVSTLASRPWSANSGGQLPIVTEEFVCDELDRLASGLTPRPTSADVIDHVFGNLGFHGNRSHYYEPDNSIIQRVIERRKGIPLTLALVAIEIGARADVELSPVGMPGHFLIGDGYKPEQFFDPFVGGRQLDRNECQVLFESLLPNAGFDDEMLRPISPTSVAARMLQNLRVAYLRVGDVAGLAAVLQMRVELSGASIDERLEYSKVLGALGRSDQAAVQLEKLAELDPKRADRYLQAATAHKARRN